MARHNHRHSDRRSLYTADSLQSVRPRSSSPRHRRRRHRHHRDSSRSPSDHSRRSHSAPRRSHRRDAKKYRRIETPSPDRRRGQRQRKRDRRRHQSLGSFEHTKRAKSRSPPPQRRHRSESKGKFTEQLLKILATTTAAKHTERTRQPENFYTSWILRPRKAATKDSSPLITNDIMRKSPQSHVNRAREELETERLRKIREEVAEAEARRTVAEEEARRVRRQNELDEAELRRQRALEQINESERQRREILLEDRLRQLEDQDFEPDGSFKKTSMNRTCCKSCKVVFGISLTLGLLFVFYLIVATIMGQPTPFDIFSYGANSNDPFLIDKNNNIITPNNTIYSRNESDYTYNFDSTTKHSPDEIDRKDTGFYDDDIYNEGETEDNYDSSMSYPEHSEDLAEYRAPDDMENSEKTMYETFENPPTLFSNSYPSDHSVNFNNPISFNSDFAPGSQIRMKHPTQVNRNFPSEHSDNINEPLILPPIEHEEPRIVRTRIFDNSHDVVHYDKDNFPQIRRKTPTRPNNFRDVQFTDHQFDATQSLDDLEEFTQEAAEPQGPYRHLIPAVRRGSRFPFRYNPTRRAGLPFVQRSSNPANGGKQVDMLEKEIVETMRKLGTDKNSAEIIKMLRSPYPPHNGRYPMRPIRRRKKGSKTRLRGRRIDEAPPIMRPPPGSPPLRIPVPEMRAIRPTRRALPLGSKPVQLDFMQALPSGGPDDVKLSTIRRGPRHSEFHSTPPEFKYPKDARSIQDIIEFMTKEEKQDFIQSKKDEFSLPNVPRDIKIGDQNHILRPSIITRKGTVRPMPRPKIKRRKSKKKKGKNNNRRRFRLPTQYNRNFEQEDELIFHDDGSISRAEEVDGVSDHDIVNIHRKNYLPPIYKNKNIDDYRREDPFPPRKVRLDIFPVISTDEQGKRFIKYESNVGPNDIHFDDHSRNSDHHILDDWKPTMYRDEFSLNDKANSRFDKNQKYLESEEDDHKSSHKIKTGADKHTITLNINLFNKKPDYDDKGRIERADRNSREISSMDIPLTKKFSILDIYHALMQQLQKEKDRPYAQFLVAEKKNSDSEDTVHIFGREEQSSLLQTLEKQFKNINRRLPDDVQVELLPKESKEDFGREDFKYTEGFEANYKNTNDVVGAVTEDGNKATSS